MKELIKIEEKDGIRTVNARDLHGYMESKQEFSPWIKNRIEKYSFEEGVDFLITLSESTGGRPATDYFLSLDMAKEIAMVENNDQGRKIRKYFIAVENAYREGKTEHKKLRDKSKQVRYSFTDTLKRHGYNKPGHYIQTSKQMKEAMGITCKKDDMDNLQLKAITAAEMISEIKIEQSGATGFHDVNPVCVECSNIVAMAIEDKKLIA